MKKIHCLLVRSNEQMEIRQFFSRGRREFKVAVSFGGGNVCEAIFTRWGRVVRGTELMSSVAKHILELIDSKHFHGEFNISESKVCTGSLVSGCGVLEGNAVIISFGVRSAVLTPVPVEGYYHKEVWQVLRELARQESAPAVM